MVKHLPKTGRTRTAKIELIGQSIASDSEESPHTSKTNFALNHTKFSEENTEHYHPYKIHFFQVLWDHDVDQQIEFCEQLMHICNDREHFKAYTYSVSDETTLIAIILGIGQVRFYIKLLKHISSINKSWMFGWELSKVGLAPFFVQDLKIFSINNMERLPTMTARFEIIWLRISQIDGIWRWEFIRLACMFSGPKLVRFKIIIDGCELIRGEVSKEFRNNSLL